MRRPFDEFHDLDPDMPPIPPRKRPNPSPSSAAPATAAASSSLLSRQETQPLPKQPRRQQQRASQPPRPRANGPPKRPPKSRPASSNQVAVSNTTFQHMPPPQTLHSRPTLTSLTPAPHPQPAQNHPLLRTNQPRLPTARPPVQAHPTTSIISLPESTTSRTPGPRHPPNKPQHTHPPLFTPLHHHSSTAHPNLPLPAHPKQQRKLVPSALAAAGRPPPPAAATPGLPAPDLSETPSQVTELPDPEPDSHEWLLWLKDHLDEGEGRRSGCVDETPPLHLGAGQFLGFSLSPTVRQLWEKHKEAFPPLVNGQLLVTLRDGVLQESVPDESVLTEPTATGKGKGRGKGRGKKRSKQDNTEDSSISALPQKSQRELAEDSVRAHLQPCFVGSDPSSMQRGPALPLVTRPEVVGPEDRRVKLRGQKALLATQDLGRHDVVGLYRSCILTKAEYYSFLLENRPYNADIEAYSVEDDADLGAWQPYMKTAEGDIKPNGRLVRLLYMGYGFGNRTALINAPQEDPSAAESAEAFEKLPTVGENNTGVYLFRLGGQDGFPVPVAIATGEVQAGQELLYDYGFDYWQTMGIAWYAQEGVSKQGGAANTKAGSCATATIGAEEVDGPAIPPGLHLIRQLPTLAETAISVEFCQLSLKLPEGTPKMAPSPCVAADYSLLKPGMAAN